MITQWTGMCAVCHRPIPAGTDVFYERGAGTQHWECHENPPATAEQHALADRLGFLPVEQAMTTDWALIHKYERMLSENGKDAEWKK